MTPDARQVSYKEPKPPAPGRADGLAGPRENILLRHGRCLLSAVRHALDDEALFMAGHLAFIALLAFFPFLIFLVTATGWLGQGEAGAILVDSLMQALPAQIAAVLEGPLRTVLDTPRGGILTVSIAVSIWTAATGIQAIRVSLDHAFESRVRRPWWRTRLESLLLVAVSPALVIAWMTLSVLAPWFWRHARGVVTFLPELQGNWGVWHASLSGCVIFMSAFSMFYLLPATSMKLRWVVPGAILVALLWLATTALFANLVNRFTGYEVIYGGLAGIVVTQLFFYSLALIFILGAEFNAALARADDEWQPKTGD